MQNLTDAKRVVYEMGDVFHESSILHFAVSCNLFDCLVDEVEIETIAKKMEWVKHKAEIFLNALVALGFVERRGLMYRNIPSTNQLLVTSSENYIGYVIEHQRLQWRLWEDVEQVLKSGDFLTLQQEKQFKENPEKAKVFTKAMSVLAKDNIKDFMCEEAVKNADFIVDLAGGHGRYLCELMKMSSHAKGEIWDLPHIKVHAESYIDQCKLSDRIIFKEKDISVSENYIASYAGLILLNDCLHYFSLDVIREILSNAKRMLKPNGSLIITTLDFDETCTSPRFSALFSFYMVMNALTGTLHPVSAINNILAEVGFKVKNKPVGELKRNQMLIATN